MRNVVTTASCLALLAALKTALLDGSVCKLFKNNITPTAGTKLADFVEADFTGYASFTLTAWGTPRIAPDLSGQCISPEAIFASSGPTITNDIYGYWLESSMGALIACGNLDGAPVPVLDVGSIVVVVLDWQQLNSSGNSYVL
jgi:hypothetical protein